MPGTNSITEDLWYPPEPYATQFVLKTASRCNLNCGYCYVYNMGDTTFERQPRVMSDEVIDATANRIGEHVRDHYLRRIDVVLHGGEPLLAGDEHIDRTLSRITQALPQSPFFILRAGMQTNGILLREAKLRAVLAKHNVRISVSLDGPAEANDRHRRYANGRGSFADVAAGLQALRDSPEAWLFGGMLNVIDLANDPAETYDALRSFRPPIIDFLLPLANHDRPPEGHGGTRYAEWLLAVHQAQARTAAAGEPAPRIRYLDAIRGINNQNVESIGLSPNRTVIIQTDGSYEQVDTLASTYDGAASLGYDVVNHSVDTALLHPQMVAHRRGAAALSTTCRQCPLVRTCGGGYYPHRYSQTNRFDNPSVYCSDLKALIPKLLSKDERPAS